MTPKIERNKISSQSDMHSGRQKKKRNSKAKSTDLSTHVRNIVSCYATGGKNHVRDSKALIAVVWEIICLQGGTCPTTADCLVSLILTEKHTHQVWVPQLANQQRHVKSCWTQVSSRLCVSQVSTHCQGCNKHRTHNSFSPTSLLQHRGGDGIPFCCRNHYVGSNHKWTLFFI